MFFVTFRVSSQKHLVKYSTKNKSESPKQGIFEIKTNIQGRFPLTILVLYANSSICLANYMIHGLPSVSRHSLEGRILLGARRLGRLSKHFLTLICDFVGCIWDKTTKELSQCPLVKLI